MKTGWISWWTLVLLALPLSGQGAEQLKLKYVQTLYADGDGMPLLAPQGVTCTEGNLFVVDSGNRRIVRYAYGAGGVTPDAVFPLPKLYPLLLQAGAGGELYLLDGKDRKIVILKADGTFKGTLEPSGLPDSAKIVPRSFRIAADGTLYLLDLFGGRVLVLSGAGAYLRQLALPPGDGFFSDLAVDSSGTILLLDSVNAVIFSAPPGSPAFVPLTASLKDRMNFPTSLNPAPQGQLYVVDKNGSGLALVGMDGAFLGRKLGLGWRDGNLYYPTAVAIGAGGELFIAEGGNNRVQQFMVAD